MVFFVVEKIVDNSLPNVWACENAIFDICMNEIEEFPRYLTNLDNIEGKFPKKYLNAAYKNLELDSVRIRKDGSLINIEHHSYISQSLLNRDFEYLTTLHHASNRLILPFIFNTGRIPNFTLVHASPTSFYNPIWINTQEIEASVKLNNIKFKISNQQELNVYDVCDLIWMAKFRTDKSIEDIIVELVGIFNNLIVEERLLGILRKCIIMWAGKFIEDKNKIKIVIRGLNMSAMETDELVSKVMKTVRIEGELYRSHENGLKQGLKEGKEIGLEKGKEIGLEEGKEIGLEKGSRDTESKFISKLLEKFTPEEISKDYDVSLQRVYEIQENIKKEK